MAKSTRIKYENPKLKQSEEADQLSYSCSNLQRNRNDINMLWPYINQINVTNKRSKKVSHTTLDNNSHREHDLKRPQLTSTDLVEPDINTESINKRTSNKKNKNFLKAGSVHEDIEISDKYLDEIVHNNNL